MSSPIANKALGLLGKAARTHSYNEILPRLYLGDITTAMNRQEMIRLGITDMITAEIKQIPTQELAQTIQRYLFINVMDHTKQDLISHFETSNEFIETALKNPTNKVYVHCVAGVSRSASIVIAYIMKTRCMNYQEALELVSQKRKVVDPNEGFVKQLVLYHKMGYHIDIGNLDYRRIVFDALVFEFRLVSLAFYQNYQMSKSANNPSTMIGNILPSFGSKTASPNKDNIIALFEQFYNKLHLQEVKNFPQVYDTKTAYKCNKCKAIIFFPISVIQNRISHQTSQDSQAGNYSNAPLTSAMNRLMITDDQGNARGVVPCSFYFIEPQPWMSKTILERDGNLECYKCKRKLGKFDWTSSESCSCILHNSHMNINLFKINKKKVDFNGLGSKD